MPDSPRKAPFHCPHCGFVQHEPVQLISTYCRSCGSHFEIARANTPAEKVPAVKPIGSRTVFCHHCQRAHKVSGHAQSTICPGCNASIELRDLVFSSQVSRPVNTRGKLTIEPGGSLNCALIICGEALIEGKINGALFCEGTVRLACSGKSSGRITAKFLIIEKGAQVELVHLVKTTDLVVNGRARGNFECDGSVRISKRGILEGRITARSVVVERGGILLAESSIQPVQRDDPPSARQDEERNALGAANPLPAY